MESSLQDGRMDEYVLMVHSLKSMSKAIGAIELSEQAKTLEFAGREGNLEELENGTKKFIREYRELGTKLKDILENTVSVNS